jgi:hypothetical protein
MDRCLGELRDAFSNAPISVILSSTNVPTGCHIAIDVNADAAAASEAMVQKLCQTHLDTAMSPQENVGDSQASQAYLCHIIITELALFIRACVMEAAAITGHRVCLNQKEKYQKFLTWKDTCAVCKEPLTLPEDFTRAISVGVRNSRVGNPVARLETSSN